MFRLLGFRSRDPEVGGTGICGTSAFILTTLEIHLQELGHDMADAGIIKDSQVKN
jgi:hypothetical protein